MMEVLQEEQGDEGCPNLYTKSILARADKGFDLQMLLESFKKDLYLPSVFVDCRDGAGTKVKMVGEQEQFRDHYHGPKQPHDVRGADIFLQLWGR